MSTGTKWLTGILGNRRLCERAMPLPNEMLNNTINVPTVSNDLILALVKCNCFIYNKTKKVETKVKHRETRLEDSKFVPSP